MRAADLSQAGKLMETLSTYRRLRMRLGDEKLRLLLGEADKASEIMLAENYLATIRADVLAGFDARIAETEEALIALGLEL